MRCPTPSVLPSTIRRSGLLAVGGSSDVRQLEQAADRGDADAALALAMFARHAAEAVAVATTTLDRFDALILTRGIGANAVGVRSEILGRLSAVCVPGRNVIWSGEMVRPVWRVYMRTKAPTTPGSPRPLE